MTRDAETVWPQLEAGYWDAEGWVDLEVYRVAAALWPFAEHLARVNLHDSVAGQKLLLKAVVEVSKVYGVEDRPIRNLKSYLFVTYKRLLLSELKKRKRQEGFDGSEVGQSVGAASDNPVDALERSILVQELVQRMDSKVRYVFERLSLGYTFEEIAAEMGTPSNVLRSKYNKMLKRLVKQISEGKQDRGE